MSNSKTNSGRKFAKIPTEYTWKNLLRGLSVNGRLLGIYLLTSPRFNMIGVFDAQISSIARETGLSKEEVSQAFEELTKKGFCKYDTHEEMVWVIAMARTQTGESKLSSQQQKGVLNELKRLADNESPFIQDFIDHYRSVYYFLPQELSELEYSSG